MRIASQRSINAHSYKFNICNSFLYTSKETLLEVFKSYLNTKFQVTSSCYFLISKGKKINNTNQDIFSTKEKWLQFTHTDCSRSESNTLATDFNLPHESIETRGQREVYNLQQMCSNLSSLNIC